MENVLLQACIFLGAAIVAVTISKQLGLGSVLGYLLAGIAISPILLFVGTNTTDIQHYAEFGVIIMLFLIGLEIKPKKIWRMREDLLGLGGLQILISSIIFTFLGVQFDLKWQTAVATAMILTLSSTAIVLQSLREKSIDKTEGGKRALSILLMQDMAVIPIIAILPLLALPSLQVDALVNAAVTGSPIPQLSNSNLIAELPALASAFVVTSAIILIILAGHFLTLPVIKYISRYGTREIFLASAFFLIISVSYVMSIIGISPGLGTFLIGIVLSNSKYRHAIAAELEPFKGLLLGLFFITVGAGINFNLLIDNLPQIIMITIGVITVKSIIIYGLAKIFLIQRDTSIFLSLALSQAGEFGFVLISISKTAHVLPLILADKLAVVIAISMLITPILFIALDKLNIPSKPKKNGVNTKNKNGSRIEE